MDEIIYEQIKQNFLTELKNASENKKSSLSFIKHNIMQKPVIKQGLVQAIVLGGTNYTVALVEINGKEKYKILKTKKGKLPIFKNSKLFSSFLEKHLDPTIHALGLNFAFALNPVTSPQNTLDGKLIIGTKEHRLDGLIGKPIGQFVRQIYFEKFKKHIPVAVANDTVCLALQGKRTDDGSLVLGSGFNICVRSSMGKEQTIINLETGDFDKFDPSQTLKIIDKQSAEPSKKLFEKTISGKYLAIYFNTEARLFNLKFPLIKTTKDLSDLAQNNNTSQSELARKILQNSASLVACSLAAIYEFRKRPTKMVLITEGSLFWGGWKYKENVQKLLLKLGVPEDTIKFKRIENSSLKGSLRLLTN